MAIMDILEAHLLTEEEAIQNPLILHIIELRREEATTDTIEEWDDRVTLYELYHHLNHYSIFGGGYRGSAVRIMEELVRRYGDGE